MKNLVSTSLLIILLGCSGNSNPYSIIGNKTLSIFNATERTIYYWAVGREVLAVINYTLDRCPDDPDRIAPGHAEQLKLGNVDGYEPGGEIVLFWWVLGAKKENGCFKPARISSLVLNLTDEKLLKSGCSINITGFTD